MNITKHQKRIVLTPSYSLMQHSKQYQLCETIVQYVVGLLFSSTHLLVLITIQNSQKPLTSKEIAHHLCLPRRLLRPFISDLVRDSFINQKVDGVAYYFIDYSKTLRNIVGSYVILTTLPENDSSSSFLKCSNIFCGWSCTYERGIDNFYNGVFFCEECEQPMHVVDNDREERRKILKTRNQLRPLKKLLMELKKTYFSIEDYPIFLIEKQQTIQEYNKRSFKEKHSKIVVNGPMPWEQEDNIQETNKESHVVIEKNKEEELNIYANIQWERPIFLKETKLFFEKTFIKDSPLTREKVPRTPRLICNTIKKVRKSRSLMSVDRKKVLM
ncbi:hypothetical protein EDI_241960 [Entamoeba dispar SAW760]|uniref:Transcription initiation factor IIE subunit alpha N-terminal domain-containing protein n=1 Tax=Entamoeba dispar (strain ATCC PRA-260 / SAW760) TaxID=370354 RepID=B0E7S2_ENTDS|nr:uncharacterized protein EDI_241960 [Entamoeba dispar SAW760]EDR29433.1 hypothetical protein EDI_241960 [Entamoeba dispar SAW760]|eukprot:EDR29433.1 hypothetical protein EDI_241960 [Entamoeba dispar SAW760]